MVDKGGRDVSPAMEMATAAVLVESARAAGVLIVLVRSVYTTEANSYLSDVWLEQAARKQGGGYTRAPVCGDGLWGGEYVRRYPTASRRYRRDQAPLQRVPQDGPRHYPARQRDAHDRSHRRVDQCLREIDRA